jgi:hypothetical protein
VQVHTARHLVQYCTVQYIIAALECHQRARTDTDSGSEGELRHLINAGCFVGSRGCGGWLQHNTGLHRGLFHRIASVINPPRNPQNRKIPRKGPSCPFPTSSHLTDPEPRQRGDGGAGITSPYFSSSQLCNFQVPYFCVIVAVSLTVDVDVAAEES